MNQNSKSCGGMEKEETVSYLNEDMMINFSQSFSTFKVLARVSGGLLVCAPLANRKASILPVIPWSNLVASCCWIQHQFRIIILKPKLLFLVEVIWHLGV